ncbi:hypothetical protein PIROE2DRAFT_39346 [Piromyces sp. E2]|nr:hypothetical protein PIROE2DRAFT_39346 [Piromyces sp. E2]|eukprot:OUM68227.1 hypothetical protein PIROE2DRAFT_39346 [Piromyces sp. E2]
MDSEVEDSEYNRNNSNNIFTYIADVLTMTIGNIHNAPLDLHALILEHPTVDSNLLFELIKTHYSQEIMGQLHKILGSADLIGNPVSLFNSISSGVYDIFYEPIQGFISDRPQDIGIGLATGTGKFVLKTISGFSSSVSQISGSIGKGLSLASMDQKFYYQRQMSVRNKPKHALGGISTGVTQFGKSVGSAISGVVEQPVNGLQKDGLGGFIKGVGKGIVGAFTKPVAGVFDLASHVTEGLKNTTSIDELEFSRIRYPRHIANNKILKVYNEKEAKGQYIKNHLYNGRYANEDYITHIGN